MQQAQRPYILPVLWAGPGARHCSLELQIHLSFVPCSAWPAMGIRQILLT